MSKHIIRRPRYNILLLTLALSISNICTGLVLRSTSVSANVGTNMGTSMGTSTSTLAATRLSRDIDSNSIQIQNSNSILNDMNMGILEPREMCKGCNRPPIQCLCDYLPPQKIALDTHVLVLVSILPGMVPCIILPVTDFE